jgi:hypothetical protein
MFGARAWLACGSSDTAWSWMMISAPATLNIALSSAGQAFFRPFGRRTNQGNERRPIYLETSIPGFARHNALAVLEENRSPIVEALERAPASTHHLVGV